MNRTTVSAIDALRQQRGRQQRFALIGQLAAVTAHEVNNAVMVITDHAQQVAEIAPHDSTVRESANTILKEAQRIADLLRSQLVILRKDPKTHQPADPGEMVRTAMGVTRSMLQHSHVVAEIRVPGGLPWVVCNKHDIQRVLINLLINACHALDERYPCSDVNKILRVTAATIEQHSRQNLRITVEDHGAGIAPEVLDRIFDPLFSTKKEGSGLGLMISRDIAKAHAGALWAESEPGRYTRFHLEIPAQCAQESRP